MRWKVLQDNIENTFTLAKKGYSATFENGKNFQTNLTYRFET